MVRGCGFMASPAVLLSAAPPSRSSSRRKSPSEMTPRKRPSSCTVVMPSFFDDISKITSAMGVVGVTAGMSSPECIRSRTLASCLPSLPPGCSSAKSSARKPLRRLTATASASPSASMAVVEAVGARFNPQASRSTEQSRATSLACAKVDCRLQQNADERVAFALEGGQQAQNLLGFSRCRERDDHVAGHQHAQVAVHGLGGMQKQRRRAGGAERGGDLLRDDAAFAHAGDHDAAVRLAAMKNHVDGAGEGLGHGSIEARGESLKRGGLGAHQLRGLERVVLLV